MNRTTTNEIEIVIAKVFKKLTASLDPQKCYRLRNAYIFKSFEDIAIEAILYAMKNSKINWDDITSAEQHLYFSAKKSSNWFIHKEFDKAKNSIVQYSFDNTSQGGEEPTQNWIDSNYSFDEYNATQKSNELLAIGRHALNNLDAFLQSKGISKRDINVYKTWELNKAPTEEVKKKFNITTNNLYRIVCIINATLQRHGHELLKAA